MRRSVWWECCFFRLCGQVTAGGPFRRWLLGSWIVIGSITIWSAVTVATGLAQGFIGLLILRISLGIAESFYLPTAGALLAYYSDPPRAAERWDCICSACSSAFYW